MKEIFLFSFNAVSPLFVVIFFGYFIARRGLIGEKETGFLNALCFRYLLPLYIFASVLHIDYETSFRPELLLTFIICDTVLFALSIAVFRLIISDREKRAIFAVNTFRSNNLIYALPLAANLFGETGLAHAAVLVPFTIIFFNFYSVIIMVRALRKQDSGAEIKKTIIEVIKNPLLVGSLAGIISALSGVKLPAFIDKGVTYAAQTASPLALILLGAQIDFNALRSTIGGALASCAVRLIIVPLITTPVFVFLGFRGSELSALAVAFAAPCAIATSIMARNYKLAPQFAAQTVYLSTVLSMFTIFILISILRALSLF